MNYLDICKVQLPVDEGRRGKPYLDSVGKLTIGVGRNLDDRGLSPDEIDYLFGNDLKLAESDARAVCPSFDNLTDSRRAVLINMSFQLGRNRLTGFSGMLSAIMNQDWDGVAREMLDSLWARQVPGRAQRLAQMMREG